MSPEAGGVARATYRPCGASWEMGLLLSAAWGIGGLGLGDAQPHPGYVWRGVVGGGIVAEQRRKWNPGFSEGCLSDFRARTRVGRRSLRTHLGHLCEFASLKTALSSLRDLETPPESSQACIISGKPGALSVSE